MSEDLQPNRLNHGRSQKFVLGDINFQNSLLNFLGCIIMYIIMSITIKTSFLLHKNLPAWLILGGYIYRYTRRRYGPGLNI